MSQYVSNTINIFISILAPLFLRPIQLQHWLLLLVKAFTNHFLFFHFTITLGTRTSLLKNCFNTKIHYFLFIIKPVFEAKWKKAYNLYTKPLCSCHKYRKMAASQRQTQIPILIKTDFEIYFSIYMWSGSFSPCELSDSFMEMGTLPKPLKLRDVINHW